MPHRIAAREAAARTFVLLKNETDDGGFRYLPLKEGKKLLAFVAAAIVGASAFALDWQSTLGLGFSIPISTFGIKDGDDDFKTTLSMLN